MRPHTEIPPTHLDDDVADRRAQSRFVRGRLLVAIGGLLVPLIGFFWAPYSGQGPVICGSRILLGLPCPGCGLTRGVSATTHLQWQAATRFHPLAVPVALSFLAVGATALVELSRGKRYPWYRRFLNGRWLWRLFWLMLLIHSMRLYVWSRDGTLQRDYWRHGWLYQQWNSDQR